MCNTSPSSPILSKSHLLNFNHHTRIPMHSPEDLHRWPTLSEVVEEIRAIGRISVPTAITGLVLYSRAMISMLFLGYLGELELAGGSLAMGFANITGYSVLSGLALGMEPICGQAFGGRHRKILGLTLQRTVLLLLSSSLPISLLWLTMKRVLLWSRQDEDIAAAAHVFIIYAIPDLFILSFLNPLRIYLRSQGITMPVTYCSLFSIILHVPLNFLLVIHFKMGISGVALAMALTNLNLVFFLLIYLFLRGLQGLMGHSMHGLSPGMVALAQARRTDLRIRVPGVVVVRAHDPALRPPRKP
ncbi:hypothetical protein J5N97_024665 [Dioscorea zingiberensis]|uniref:Protein DETOXIFICATION n=1 Tax=Dioscorea zingiberensis TaxID=325984 RepID=A0A9D5C7K4_9LILI|nr:hypothetical protein J5N97_024665 [Dioscorea zingiberensis]